MRILTGTVVALIAFLGLPAPSIAQSHLLDGLPHKDGVLGYVSRQNRDLAIAPRYDRYANAIQQRAARVAITRTIELPGDHFADRDYVTMCTSLNLSGFLEPHVDWHVSDADVSGSAIVVISDCTGRVVYAGGGSYREARDFKLSVDQQSDAVQAKALDAAAISVAAFTTARPSNWLRLLAGGVYATTDEPAVVGIIALHECATLVDARRYAAAVDACARARSGLETEIPKLNILLQINGLSSTDLTHITTYGTAVASMYYLMANAQAKLGHLDTGRPMAIRSEAWVLALTSFYLKHFPDHTGEPFTKNTTLLAGFSADLSKNYSDLVKATEDFLREPQR